MQTAAFPASDSHHPATFELRGAAVPFTTPMLAGARVRLSKRTGTELVVPNPSGSRGIYVVLWAGVRDLCNPTVHDRRLIEYISRLPQIDPAAVRKSGLEVALEGYAGRGAVAAAEAARESDDAHRLLAHFRLLAELIEQVEPTGRKATALVEKTQISTGGLALRCAASPLRSGGL